MDSLFSVLSNLSFPFPSYFFSPDKRTGSLKPPKLPGQKDMREQKPRFISNHLVSALGPLRRLGMVSYAQNVKNKTKQGNKIDLSHTRHKGREVGNKSRVIRRDILTGRISDSPVTGNYWIDFLWLKHQPSAPPCEINPWSNIIPTTIMRRRASGGKWSCERRQLLTLLVHLLALGIRRVRVVAVHLPIALRVHHPPWTTWGILSTRYGAISWLIAKRGQADRGSRGISRGLPCLRRIRRSRSTLDLAALSLCLGLGLRLGLSLSLSRGSTLTFLGSLALRLFLLLPGLPLFTDFFELCKDISTMHGQTMA